MAETVRSPNTNTLISSNSSAASFYAAAFAHRAFPVVVALGLGFGLVSSSAASAASAASGAAAERSGFEPVQRHAWKPGAKAIDDVPEGVRVQVESVQSAAGQAFSALRVENTRSEPRTVRILALRRPALDAKRYAMVGQVRYQGVQGDGYLQMWSYFPDGGRYFTRTMAPSGPMAKLTGSSGWRRFVMPFDARQAATPPSRIAVDVVLPGRGTVWLGPLTLGEQSGAGAGAGARRGRAGERQPRAPSSSAAVGVWWSAATAGLLGAGGGVGLAVIALALYWLGLRRRRPRLLRRVLPFVLLVAASGLGAGFVALARGQPYAVYYPLLLLGGLGVGLVLLFGLLARRLTAQLELRRMQAMDS